MLKKYVIKISFQQKVKLVFPASLYFCNVLLQQTFFSNASSTTMYIFKKNCKLVATWMHYVYVDFRWWYHLTL